MDPTTHILRIEGTPGYSPIGRDSTADIQTECPKSSNVTPLKMAKSFVGQTVTGIAFVDHHVLS
jgi:hypothetical protein